MLMLNILRRHPGILFNLLFLAFFAFVEPAVLARLVEAVDNGARDPLLGVIFLSAPFLELAGFYLVAPALIDRLAQAPRQPSTLPGLVWLAHFLITLVLAVVVIKEIGYLLYWIDRTDPEHVELRSRLSSLRSHPVSAKDQIFASLLLAPFAFLGFTGFWDLLIARNPIHWSQPGDALVELGLAVFVFLVLFAACRSLYLIEEWAFLRGRIPVLVWIGTLLLNLSLALASLPRA